MGQIPRSIEPISSVIMWPFVGGALSVAPLPSVRLSRAPGFLET